MLKKCLKYDLKSLLFIWSVLSTAIITLSAPAGISMGMMISDSVENELFATLAVICIALYFTLTCGYLIYGIAAGVRRFYLNFRTDEAYLTFTLPVKRSTLLNSKLLATLISFVATLTVAMISILIFLSFVPDGDRTALRSIFIIMGEGLKEAWADGGILSMILILEFILLAIEITVTIILACFSFANRTNESSKCKKITKKIIIGILIYFGFGLLFIPLMVIIGTILSYTEAVAILGTLGDLESLAVLLLTMNILNMAATILNVSLYYDNLNIIKNKLNLA